MSWETEDYADILNSVKMEAMLTAARNLALTADLEVMMFTHDSRVTVDSDRLLEFMVAYHSIQPLHEGGPFRLQDML